MTEFRLDERAAVAASAIAIATLFLSGVFAVSWSGVMSELSVETASGPRIIDLAQGQCVDRGDADAPLAAEFKARMMLSMTTTVALTVAFLVLLSCLLSLAREMQRMHIVSLVPVALGIAGVAWYLLGVGKGYLFPVLGSLLECAAQFAPTGNSGGLPLVRFGNSLVVLAAAAFLASVWQTMLSLPAMSGAATDDSRAPEDAEDALRRANRKIVAHLYLASALLVVTVFALHSYYSWPAALAAGELRTALEGLATVIAIFFGGVFTLLVIFVLGPAMLALNYRTVAVARKSLGGAGSGRADDSAIAAWIEKNGLNPTGYQQSFRILAAFGPVLAGPLIELLRIAVP